MPTITRITPQKDTTRFNIFVDGEFAFGLDADNIVKEGLHTGQQLSPEDISKLIQLDQFQKLLEKTCQFASSRPHSQKEIEDYFHRKQVSPDIASKIMDKLRYFKLVDDLAFAQWWLEQRSTFRPKSRPVLKFELAQKGINQEIITQVLTNISPKSEYESALQVAHKYSKSPQLPQSPQFRQKLTAFLARRGFSWDIIKQVLQNF